MPEKSKILFVGAGGVVASKLLPELAKRYAIVGMGGSRRELEPYCIDFLTGEISGAHERLFNEASSQHSFAGIIWNVVRYNPSALLASSRGTLHLEFDLAVALPLECLKVAHAHGFTGSIILVTSGLAFGVKPGWGSYSIAKHGQVILAQYLATELAEQRVHAKAIALGAIADLSAETLAEAFTHAIENTEPTKVVYKVYGPTWE